MQTRAAHLSNSRQTWQTTRAIYIGLDSTTLIMCRRYDWDWLLSHIDPETQTSLIDVGKSLLKKFAWLMRDIEKNALRPGTLNLGVDGTSDNISRSEKPGHGT